jgi:protein involved in polysaccharide export with SLBB domain
MKKRHAMFGLSILLVGGLLGAGQKSKELYIGGDVQRPGAHLIANRDATIFTVGDWAGLKDTNADYSVTVIHRVNDKLEVITSYNSIKALKAAKIDAVSLHEDDQVQFKLVK